MDALVNDEQTYEELKRELMPALQCKLNRKLLQLKKADTTDLQRYNRPPKLYGLLKLHKPDVPMRPIV